MKKNLKNAKNAKNEKNAKMQKMQKNENYFCWVGSTTSYWSLRSFLIGEVRCGCCCCSCGGKQSHLLLQPTNPGLGLQVPTGV